MSAVDIHVKNLRVERHIRLHVVARYAGAVPLSNQLGRAGGPRFMELKKRVLC